MMLQVEEHDKRRLARFPSLLLHSGIYSMRPLGRFLALAKYISLK